jgi:hypothetical protein
VLPDCLLIGLTQLRIPLADDLAMRTWVKSSSTTSGSNRPPSIAYLSCMKLVMTSLMSSAHMPFASVVLGSTRSSSSKWNWPRSSLKPTLVPSS